MFRFSLGILVSFKMYHGTLEQVKKEEPSTFRHIAIARKLGFSDVIMPGKLTVIDVVCLGTFIMISFDFMSVTYCKVANSLYTKHLI